MSPLQNIRNNLWEIEMKNENNLVKIFQSKLGNNILFLHTGFIP
jgi:hypothetical protein